MLNNKAIENRIEVVIHHLIEEATAIGVTGQATATEATGQAIAMGATGQATATEATGQATGQAIAMGATGQTNQAIKAALGMASHIYQMVQGFITEKALIQIGFSISQISRRRLMLRQTQIHIDQMKPKHLQP